MTKEAEFIWEDVLKVVSSRFQDGKALPWFERIIPQSVENNTLSCTTKLNFTVRMFMKQYKELAESILQEITMEPYQIILLEDDQAPESYTYLKDQEKSEQQPVYSTPNKSEEYPTQVQETRQFKVTEHAAQDTQLNQNTQNKAQFQTEILKSSDQEVQTKIPDLYQRTFDTFIAADSNNAAMVSAQRVAEMPGKVFNPFFLYSKSGLGKTHLLMAIKNYVEQHYPNKTAFYVTSEQFLQDYIKELAESKKKQTGQPIMTKYRSVDVLLVDDIQFFEGKNESQEYFFATFEDLTQKGAQVVLSADRSPKDLRMDERMTSRFQSGLCQNIQPPSFELKLAILKAFYERNSVIQPWFDAKLPDTILSYIAEVSSSNIREIEGFLTQVMVYASTKNKAGGPITKQDIITLANESFHMRKKVIGISTIQREVAKFYQLTRDDLIGAQRLKNINHARQVAMYLSRDLTDESFTNIGKHFGGRDHTTIMNGVQNIEKLMKTDRNFFDNLEKLKDIIRQMS